MIRFRIDVAFAAILSFAAGSVLAQNETETIADAIVRAQAPAADDPDAVVRDLVATALAHRRSPAAWFLVQEAIALVGQVQDPASVRALLEPAAAGERQHGRLAQKLAELRWWIGRAIEGPLRTGRLPLLGYCRSAVVAGPFGDDGDHFAGIPFAPELRFPAIDSEVPGRGGPVRVRRVVSHPESDYLVLRPPGDGKPGCYYALHRFAVDAALDAFAEVEFDGDFQLFADGAEVLRVERWQATAPRRHHVGLHLPAGEHTVLLKTCSNERDRYALRWLDADANHAAAVRQIRIDDPAAEVGAHATRLEAAFVTADDVLTRAAEQPGAPPSVRIAGLLLAIRENNHDLALRLLEPLRAAPPADGAVALAFARVLRSAPLPDERRKAEARKIEEAAIASLPAEHHAARLAKVQLLDEQDQREQALRLLAAHPAPGTWTFQRRLGLLRDLKFTAEEVPLLEQWAARCPRDARPLFVLADQAAAAGDGARAHELRKRAAALDPDATWALNNAINGAIDVGDFESATAWLDALDPVPGDQKDLDRLVLEASIANGRGDAQQAAASWRTAAAHPEATEALLFDVAGRLARTGDRDGALACLRRSLERFPDQPRVRAWLATLGAAPAEHADFVQFRRDGAKARAEFVAGEREKGASATVLIDQRIVELRADGSWTSETHELRRINDQAGVDEYRTASPLSGADEVLLVRTIGTDGHDWIPSRVENEYSLQRLEPGAFVEWRFRERGGAPGAGEVAAGQFLFGSATEPVVLSELIVIRPTAGRGEVRTRGLPEPTETVDLADGRKATVYRRENVPALPREQFVPPVQESLPVVEIGEDTPPFARLRQIRVWIGTRTKPTAPVRARAAALFAGLADRALVEKAWSWCQTEIESGPADSALDTLLRKKGNRFLLAVALLRAAGLDVAPLACPEVRPDLRSHGESLFASGDDHEVPGAMVTLGNGERIHLFIDTPRHWPLGAVPAQRAGATALLMRDDRVESVVLPTSDDAPQSLRVRGDARVENNEIRVEATLEIGDTQGFGLIERLREMKDNQQKLAARQIAQQIFAGFRVRSAALAGTEPGKPLRIQASLTRGGVQAKSDGFVMPLPLSPTKYVASFGDRAERTMPFEFLGDLASQWQIDVDPGDGMRFVDCPAPTAIRTGPLTYELQCTRTEHGLRFSRTARIRPGRLPANRFGEWLRALADADRADQMSVPLAARKAN